MWPIDAQSGTQKQCGNTQSGASSCRSQVGRLTLLWFLCCYCQHCEHQSSPRLCAVHSRALRQQMVRLSPCLSGRTPGPWLHAEAAGQSSDDIKGRNSQLTLKTLR
uniref:WAS/WASL interacting protein family member 3 n=1 Tax=Myotis myotis TaxID=51298 RepID=A0A7J7V579_MYOMY|nr:WAS/WASL interacting protein family member 3 [Myotis myotis]